MRNTYDEILKIWNYETPDDFAIFSELYYEMFGGEEEIPYTTSSTLSLIHISEPTRQEAISYAVFCLKKKK